MKKKDEITEPIECEKENFPCDCENQDQPEKKDISDRIYAILDVAEKIAIKLAHINSVIKKKKKKQKKKYKKYGKVNKKTGNFMLKKKPKKAKKAKFYKRAK